MQPPHLVTRLFRPGQRIAVAVSGGADSIALLRRLLEQRHHLGIVLSVAHVHHGIRGTEADTDAAFVADLASIHNMPFHLHRTDAPAAAAILHETLEEAARNLRYAWFRQLLEAGEADAVATAHTLDDQAETVLHKLLRGAGTEGLSGIHPVVGNIVRPFLETTRASIEAWLLHLSQPWREDATNQDLAHTRNRIRHQLLPLLRSFNPQIATQLSRLAAISGEEEDYWQAELQRLMPSLLLPGRPTRGGGRSSSTHPEEETVAIELARLRALHPAVGRRVVRDAARRLGARLTFDQTDQLLAMVESGTRKFELPGGIVAERSLREIRLSRSGSPPDSLKDTPTLTFPIPGEIQAPAYSIQLRAEHSETGQVLVRAWKAGDRVTLRYSQGPKKVAEVLDRLHVLGNDRKSWPVMEWQGKIVWMRGADVDAPGFLFTALGNRGSNSTASTG